MIALGCAETPEKPAGTQDSGLAVRVKASLIRTLETDAASINVEAENGRVRLLGFVGSESQKTAAERIAGQVEGVRRVVNEIEVKGSSI